MPQGINPEVGYEFDAFRLNGGLDLTSPKIDASKGSLLDCLNRDTIDRIGYRRINGFEPYDGRVSPAQPEYYVLRATSFSGSVELDGSLTDYQAGTLLTVDGDANTVFGIVVFSLFIAVPSSGNRYDIVYARINEDAEPTSGESILPHGGGDSFTVSSKFSYVGDDAQDTVTDMNVFSAELRAQITSLPDVPIGLHWYRDRLYSVVDDQWFYFDSGGTVQPRPNQFIGDGSTAQGRILSVQIESGTWAGGDAKGIIQYENLGAGTFANNTELNIYPDDTFTTPSSSNVLTVAAASDFTTPPEPLYASLWRSLSEQQAIDETGSIGWSRIDLGYEARFTNGVSDTDGLTVVSRGSDNNFDFTSSDVSDLPFTIYNGTAVSGTTFAPNSTAGSAALFVESGDPGWKTNDTTPGEWATPAQILGAIDALDANYAYANLHFQCQAINTPFPQGELVSLEKGIFGPLNWPFGGGAKPADLGTQVFDVDYLTTNARAPLILNDFSGAATSIPEGALIVGIGVSIPDYDVQSYAFGTFNSARYTGSDSEAGQKIADDFGDWMASNASWHTCLCRSNNSTSAAIIGSVQSAPLAFPTTTNTTYQTAYTSGNYRVAANLTDQSVTIGGDGNIFGAGTLTRSDLLDTDFGIALYAGITSASPYPFTSATSTGVMQKFTASSGENLFGSVRMKVYQITVTFYYTLPSARYYVGDGGGNVCSVDVTYYVQEDGTWSSGTASGTVQFTNIIPGAGSKRTVEEGDKFYLTGASAAADTNPVLTIDASGTGADYNGLPAKNRIITCASRYEFITANFFGRDEWDGFYGVSGAGRAFSFATYNADKSLDGSNEDYLIQITTNTLDRDGDIPRHIAFHHYALALGYKSGIVRLSVLGEPENFDGADGAAEIGVGDKVTGLLSMRGTVLGVFCENSIWGIAGTDSDNYQTQVLVPYNGAIEYSVVDMGIPVYCDNRGVSTLEQSEKYGNFQGRRLSYNVTPFILPRMIRNNAQFSGKGIVCAIPFRADNQYLVFFKDGRILVMTMNPDGTPTMTYSTYYIGSGTSGNFMVPFAWSAQVDDKGVDRVHVSHFSPISTVSEADSKKVYEINKGWGFAGEPIPNYYTCNWYYKDPFTYTTLKKIRIDGLTYGVSSCRVYLAKEYDTTFSTAYTDANLRVGQVGGTQIYLTDPVPASVMANVTERGRSITFKVEGSNTAPIPPDIHQIILPHFDAGGKIDS